MKGVNERLHRRFMDAMAYLRLYNAVKMLRKKLGSMYHHEIVDP